MLRKVRTRRHGSQKLQGRSCASSTNHTVFLIVLVFFAGAGPGSLRADVEAHASDRGMSPCLRQGIFAYQLCMLDDTVAEVVHRDVLVGGIVLLRLA